MRAIADRGFGHGGWETCASPMNGGALARYFLHRIDGALDLDNEGVELPGLDEAKYEAVVFASDTMKEERFALWEGGEVRIELTDEDRVLLFTVFLKAETPHLAGQDRPS